MQSSAFYRSVIYNILVSESDFSLARLMRPLYVINLIPMPLSVSLLLTTIAAVKMLKRTGASTHSWQTPILKESVNCPLYRNFTQ